FRLAWVERAVAEGRQGRTVPSHVVESTTGETLPGVNIILHGTTLGTVTDMDGSFSIQIPQGGGVLVFSFIGYIRQEVNVGPESIFDIALEPDVSERDDVVDEDSGSVKYRYSNGYGSRVVGYRFLH